MTESFLILLAGGIMLAAAISDPKQVTLNWLRLCGILALVMAGLSMSFLFRRERPATTFEIAYAIAAIAAILGQLAFVQIAWLKTQQVMAALAFLLALQASSPGNLAAYASAIGIAAMTGIALMDMLLGHAYLTASMMTMAPFRRLNGFLAGTIVWRTILAGIATALMTREIWLRNGLFVLTRILVGLLLPAIFVYMAHDCINRRSTQSATGILYVTGVLVFIGEIIALYLVRSSGLPF
jgi:hypothetical protein